MLTSTRGMGVGVRPSPNEEMEALRSERQERRKLRIQQVREQEQQLAAATTERIRQHKQQMQAQAAAAQKVLNAIERKEEKKSLEELYQTSMSYFGSGHEAARELQESAADTQYQIDQSRQHKRTATKRHRHALTRLRSERDAMDAKERDAREKLERARTMERERAARVAAKKKESANRAKVSSKKHKESKQTLPAAKDISTFSKTHFHLDRQADAKTAHSGRTPLRHLAANTTNAVTAAATEAQRYATAVDEDARTAEARERRTHARGVRAANKVRLQNVHKTVERDLAALTRHDYDHRKSELLHRHAPVTNEALRLARRHRRQQTLEEVFERTYLDDVAVDGRALAGDAPRVQLLAADPEYNSHTAAMDGARPVALPEYPHRESLGMTSHGPPTAWTELQPHVEHHGQFPWQLPADVYTNGAAGVVGTNNTGQTMSAGVRHMPGTMPPSSAAAGNGRWTDGVYTHVGPPEVHQHLSAPSDLDLSLAHEAIPPLSIHTEQGTREEQQYWSGAHAAGDAGKERTAFQHNHETYDVYSEPSIATKAHSREHQYRSHQRPETTAEPNPHNHQHAHSTVHTAYMERKWDASNSTKASNKRGTHESIILHHVRGGDDAEQTHVAYDSAATAPPPPAVDAVDDLESAWEQLLFVDTMGPHDTRATPDRTGHNGRGGPSVTPTQSGDAVLPGPPLDRTRHEHSAASLQHDIDMPPQTSRVPRSPLVQDNPHGAGTDESESMGVHTVPPPTPFRSDGDVSTKTSGVSTRDTGDARYKAWALDSGVVVDSSSVAVQMRSKHAELPTSRETLEAFAPSESRSDEHLTDDRNLSRADPNIESVQFNRGGRNHSTGDELGRSLDDTMSSAPELETLKRRVLDRLQNAFNLEDVVDLTRGLEHTADAAPSVRAQQDFYASTAVVPPEAPENWVTDRSLYPPLEVSDGDKGWEQRQVVPTPSTDHVPVSGHGTRQSMPATSEGAFATQIESSTCHMDHRSNIPRTPRAARSDSELPASSPSLAELRARVAKLEVSFSDTQNGAPSSVDDNFLVASTSIDASVDGGAAATANSTACRTAETSATSQGPDEREAPDVNARMPLPNRIHNRSIDATDPVSAAVNELIARHTQSMMVAPGRLYPPGTMHYDRSDTDDDCSPTDTALQALVRSNALYRGHPAVVRAAPGPTPMRNADSTRDATVSLLGDTRGSTGGLDDLQGSSPSSTRANDESKTTPTGSTLGMPQHKSSPPRGLHQRPWQAMGSDADSATQPSLQDAFLRHKQRFIKRSSERLEGVAVAKALGNAHARVAPTHPLPSGAALSRLAVERSRQREAARASAHIGDAARPGAGSGGASCAPRAMGQSSRGTPGTICAAGTEDGNGTREGGAPPLALFEGRRHMSKQEISSINHRLYNSLCPEVRQRREEAKKSARYADNRAKAKEYAEMLKLRRKRHSRTKR